MTLRRELGLTLAALLAVSATGCASMATKPGPAAAGAPPASATHVPAHSSSPGTASSTSPPTAAIDSTTPSPAAQRVLGSIPEPLTPAQQALSAQAAPAAVDTSRMRAVAPAAAYDSLQAAPVPAATQPLGTETSTVTMDTASAAPALSAAGGAATSTAAAGAAAGAPTGAAAAPTASTAPASSTAATSGPCWRLQVGAPLASEKDKADSRREAAQSLLMTPFTIVPEKGYLKIRTGDCMSRDAADALKKRAVDSGFGDAFLLDTNAAAPAAAPATKHAHVPASKRKK
jgi:hypothetical protein